MYPDGGQISVRSRFIRVVLGVGSIIRSRVRALDRLEIATPDSFAGFAGTPLKETALESLIFYFVLVIVQKEEKITGREELVGGPTYRVQEERFPEGTSASRVRRPS